MKICPTCQKTYSDDGLNFCLDDGATLIHSNAVDAAPPTVLLNQTRTNNSIDQIGSQSGWNAPNQFSMQPPPPAAKNSKTWLWVIGILGGLVLLCGGGLTGFVFWAANQDNDNRNFNTGFNSNRLSNISTPTNKTSVDKIDLSRWTEIDKTGVGNTSYENGEFIMSSKESRYYYVLVSRNTYQTENATTRVTVRNVEEKNTSLGIGLIVHSNPTPLVQDYAFLIDSENKKYRVVRHTPQTEIVITKWTYSAAIKDGSQPNVLEVRDKNKKMSFYINNQLITTLDNTDGYAGGVPGIYSGNSVPAAFSNFEIEK